MSVIILPRMSRFPIVRSPAVRAHCAITMHNYNASCVAHPWVRIIRLRCTNSYALIDSDSYALINDTA